MDPLILLLLVFIGLAGGIIGVIADHLGRKIGKKKLSFRSMRPKHVARLGTFLAGILISAFTIVLVFFTSSDIRQWIMRGRHAIQDSKALAAKNQRLEADIRAKTGQIDQLDREAKVAKDSLSAARARLASVQTDLSGANQRLADASKRVEEGKLALFKNQELLRRNASLLASRQAKLAMVQANLKSTTANLSSLKRNFGAVNAERVEANEKVLSLRQQADTLTGEVAQLRKDSDQLKRDKAEAMVELTAAQTDLKDQKDELARVQSALSAARSELETAQESTGKFQVVAGITRHQPLVFQFDQEVQRLEIGPHLTERQARQALEKLLSEASKNAQTRGASPPRGSLLCVFLPARQQQNGQDVSPGQQEEEIIQSITGQDHDIVLISEAYVNTFVGEAVPLKIAGFDNPIVYHKDEVVAELRVGRNWPEEKVFAEFHDFMDQQVHDKIKDKMIPVAGQEASLIEVAPARTLAVVERLTRAPRDTVLQVTAHAETRAADSLQLDFKYK